MTSRLALLCYSSATATTRRFGVAANAPNRILGVTPTGWLSYRTAFHPSTMGSTTHCSFHSSSRLSDKVESITYSGGQASVGQGGFYGSGGARVLDEKQQQQLQQQQSNERNKMLALAHDVQSIRTTMQELEKLESLLRGEEADSTSNGSAHAPSSKRMEIKNSIKKLMTAPTFIESLNNVQVQGKPAWGLSREEHELILTARNKVNEC